MFKQSALITLAFTVMIFTVGCSPKTADTVATTTAKVPAMAPSDGKAYTITVVDSAPKSPRKEMRGKVDGVDVVINYGSPYAKGRQILNGLIPYGKVWRSGANEATTIEFSKDLMVEGKRIAAGKYGLFTLNNEGSTQVIFNSVADQWGAYDYDAKKDVLRVKVTPSVSADKAESMDFRVIGNTIMLVWDTVVIPFDAAKA